MNGLETVRALIDKGYTPAQAAALAGHVMQESGFDPSNVNKGEDAHGLVQWRGDRWQGLQDFAKAQGKSPTDPLVQMDFIGHEMRGPEAKAGAGFMAAPDVASASAALKPYIRYADPGGAQTALRTNNAVGLLAQYNGGAPTAPVDPTNPADPTQSVAAPAAPLSIAPDAATPVGSLASSLQSLGGSLGGGTSGQPAQQPAAPDFLAPQQIAMPQANTGQSQQIAAALAKMYGIGA